MTLREETLIGEITELPEKTWVHIESDLPLSGQGLVLRLAYPVDTKCQLRVHQSTKDGSSTLQSQLELSNLIKLPLLQNCSVIAIYVTLPSVELLSADMVVSPPVTLRAVPSFGNASSWIAENENSFRLNSPYSQFVTFRNVPGQPEKLFMLEVTGQLQINNNHVLNGSMRCLLMPTSGTFDLINFYGSGIISAYYHIPKLTNEFSGNSAPATVVKSADSSATYTRKQIK